MFRRIDEKQFGRLCDAKYGRLNRRLSVTGLDAERVAPGANVARQRYFCFAMILAAIFV